MLLQNPLAVEKRCPRLWSLAAAGSLLTAAVLVSGLGFRAEAAPAPEIKKEAPTTEEPKKEQSKRDEVKKEEPRKGETPVIPFPEIEDIIKSLPEDLDLEKVKEIRKEMDKAREEVRKALEELRKHGPGGFPGRGPAGGWGPGGSWGGRWASSDNSRLGIRVDKPSATLVEQLDLPKNQGLVIDEVKADSAAAKAGIKVNDILLELNGKAVPSEARDFVKLVEDVKVNTPVIAVVLRKGKKETIKGLSLPEAKGKDERGGRGGFPFPNLPFGPNVPGGGPQIQIQGGGPGMVMTTTTRQGGRFTTNHQDGALLITITGTFTEGKAKVGEITVNDAGVTTRCESLDKLDSGEKFRPRTG